MNHSLSPLAMDHKRTYCVFAIRPLETVEKPIGFFDKVSCRTLRAPFVRLRRTKNTLASYKVFCVVYTPLHKMNLILFAAKAANSAKLF